MLEDICLVVVALRLAVCLCQQICADFSVQSNLRDTYPTCTEPREFCVYGAPGGGTGAGASFFFFAVVVCTIQYARRRLCKSWLGS